ncbi:hypothetical protein [Rhizobium lentis]|uniref:hypothetical protein n=1 Tax=Rhizobium lentis TaxID=1138194 RepID=UPI001C83EAF8|nr:hypothetical protein [Rhizobium lentis]MBX5034241.1 hypothetical protein [Rhizobium lentis]
MKSTHALVPVIGSAIAIIAVSVDFWDASKAPILTALSVIGAGVLVRLARGLPFTNVDQFQVDEARRIAAAIKQSIRTLRALIFIIIFTMVSLVLAKGLVLTLAARWPDWANIIGMAASGAIGLLLSYILIRVTAVIQGDVGLVDLQAEFFVRAVERKQAERFDKSQSGPEVPALENPKGYGKIVQ